MLDQISLRGYEWLQGGTYHPHAICLLYDPGIIAVEAGLNLGIALAYFAIAYGLALLFRALGDLPFRSVFVMFAAFILACGLSHVTKTLTLFVGGWAYSLDIAVCSLTLVFSVATAIQLFRHGRAIVVATGRLLAARAA